MEKAASFVLGIAAGVAAIGALSFFVFEHCDYSFENDDSDDVASDEITDDKDSE